MTSAGDAGTGTLRDAINVANQTPGPDTIEFATGLGDIVLQSEIEILEALDIVGPDGQQVIRGSGSGRLLAVRTSGAVVTLENLFLADGRSTGPGGGACQAYVIPRGTVASYGDGGAVCSIADVSLVGTTITGSSVSGDYISGGGLFSSGSVTMVGSTVSNNSTDGEFSRGGGIFAGAGLVMNDSIVSGNSTAGDNANGGGIWFGDDTQIVNSVISGNRTTGNFADGGGLTGAGTLVLEDSSVVGNTTSGAAAEGGGIRLSSTSQIINSTISGNSTAAVDAPGGGIFLLGTNLAVVNSTITANTSQAGAGGVESRAQENLTYFVQVQSSIIAANSGPSGNSRTVAGSGTIVVDVANSLFGDARGEINGTNTDNVFSNSPGLAALADNGCGVLAGAPPAEVCVPTHLLVAGSAAIDRGSNPLALEFDQRGGGFPRTRGGVTDIGALESNLPPAQPVPADLRVSKTDSDVVTGPGERLTWRIDFANIGELAAQGVALVETVPDSTVFNPSLSADWICDSDGSAGSQCLFEIGELAAGAAGTVDFSVIIDEEPLGREVVNRVEIVGAEGDAPDPNPENNVAVEATPLSSPGKITVPGRGSNAGGFVIGYGDPDGTSAAPRLGEAAIGVGDLDGDGLSDVAVSAPGADAIVLLPGRPFGNDALALSTFPSADSAGFLVQATDGFGGLGDRLAGIGDINGDGLEGLAYTDGAVGFNPLTGPRRAAFVQPGFAVPPTFVVDQGGRFSPQDGPELISLQASGPFATSLAGLGDIDADGLDDLALAFSFGMPPFQFETVFALFGDSAFVAFQPDTFVVEDASAANGLRLTNSESPQTGFGTSITGLGDFNGDGVDDFAVSAPRQGSGAVFVVFGNAAIADSSEGLIDIQSLDGSNGFAVLGGDDGAAFGTRITGAGDFDGDGLADLVVSERPTAGAPGRLHLVFGTAESLPAGVSLDDAGALRTTRIRGVAGGDDFGLSSAGLGDIDGDGRDDLAIGVPGLAEAFDGQPPAADTGRVFVLFGTADPPAEYAVAGVDAGQGYWLTAPSPGIRFGAAVAGPGDFDGDGVPDLLVTAPEAAFEGVPGAGQFWIVSGALRPAPGELAVEIQAFGVTPDPVSAGDIVEISWAAAPDDALTECTGSGLPGTSWQGTGKPASGTTQVDTSPLAPGTYFPALTCARDGETAEADTVLEVLAPPLEIQEFSVTPDALFVGTIAEISWTAAPDDATTVCAGSGLPGTGWNTSGLPASGTLEIETSALAPGTYFPTLTCEGGGMTVDAGATLEVLEPPVVLSLAGNRTGLQFFGDRFVQVELTNESGESAESIALDLVVPAGYQAISVFRLAGSCSADQAGDLSCDAGSIPDWQCGPATGGFACQLDSLPAEATAAVLLQLRGDGAGQVEAAANAANAAPVAIGIPVLD